MDLSRYLQALKKFWWVALIPLVLGGSYGAYKVRNVDPEYRAAVTFFVVASSADETTQARVQGDQFAQNRVTSYVALLGTDRLATNVADAVGSDVSPAQVQRMIGASGNLDTVLLTATVTSGSADLSDRVADAVATEFVDLVEELEGGGPAAVRLEVVSNPSASQVPQAKTMVVGLYAVLGLVVGLGLAALLELRDTAVRTSDQVRDLGAAPVLGNLPADRRIKNSPLLAESEGSSAFTEELRQLRTNLQFVNVDHPVQLLAVTSSVSSEGKSVTSANIAIALATSGMSVLLVDADLRRPRIAGMFGIDDEIGLSTVLAGGTIWNEALQFVTTSRLVVLPSGPIPPNPSELIGSDRMLELLGELREQFDVIVIDTAPLLPVTDGLILAAEADGVLLVTRSGKTKRQELAESVQSLETVDARLLGTVLTMTKTRRSTYST